MKTIQQQQQAEILNIIDCGIEDYSQILNKQLDLCSKRQLAQIGNTVLLVEHKPVITLGVRQRANKLVLDKQELAEKGIDVVEVRRGGGVTAHNPGQVIFYPIVNLKELGIGISDYVRTLEQVGIELLRFFDVSAGRRKGYPGLWIGEKKIASIGVRVSKSVTYHGMAININNDLSIFDYIVPCGLENVKMTSVFAETGKQIPMHQIKQQLKKILNRFLK
ncbi:MAG: lipoyl(octanoyl) transferase LipB [Phycisphaerae bacterium]|jgi:lipoate-protein ligase B